jgi:hypothetical protein
MPLMSPKNSLLAPSRKPSQRRRESTKVEINVPLISFNDELEEVSELPLSDKSMFRSKMPGSRKASFIVSPAEVCRSSSANRTSTNRSGSSRNSSSLRDGVPPDAASLNLLAEQGDDEHDQIYIKSQSELNFDECERRTNSSASDESITSESESSEDNQTAVAVIKAHRKDARKTIILDLSSDPVEDEQDMPVTSRRLKFDIDSIVNLTKDVIISTNSLNHASNSELGGSKDSRVNLADNILSLELPDFMMNQAIRSKSRRTRGLSNPENNENHEASEPAHDPAFVPQQSPKLDFGHQDLPISNHLTNNFERTVSSPNKKGKNKSRFAGAITGFFKKNHQENSAESFESYGSSAINRGASIYEAMTEMTGIDDSLNEANNEPPYSKTEDVTIFSNPSHCLEYDALQSDRLDGSASKARPSQLQSLEDVPADSLLDKKRLARQLANDRGENSGFFGGTKKYKSQSQQMLLDVSKLSIDSDGASRKQSKNELQSSLLNEETSKSPIPPTLAPKPRSRALLLSEDYESSAVSVTLSIISPVNKVDHRVNTPPPPTAPNPLSRLALFDEHSESNINSNTAHIDTAPLTRRSVSVPVETPREFTDITKPERSSGKVATSATPPKPRSFADIFTAANDFEFAEYTIGDTTNVPELSCTKSSSLENPTDLPSNHLSAISMEAIKTNRDPEAETNANTILSSYSHSEGNVHPKMLRHAQRYKPRPANQLGRKVLKDVQGADHKTDPPNEAEKLYQAILNTRSFPVEGMNEALTLERDENLSEPSTEFKEKSIQELAEIETAKRSHDLETKSAILNSEGVEGVAKLSPSHSFASLRQLNSEENAHNLPKLFQFPVGATEPAVSSVVNKSPVTTETDNNNSYPASEFETDNTCLKTSSEKLHFSNFRISYDLIQADFTERTGNDE